MSEDDPTTWAQVRMYVRRIVAADVATGTLTADIINDDDAVDEYAHEWADGDRIVIYYHLARALWCDSSDVQGFEDIAWETVDRDTASIDQVVSACVYLALRDEITAAVQELRDSQSAA